MKNINQNIIDCKIGKNTKIWHFVNLYGCTIGENCMIGSFVEIQEGAKLGNHVEIQSHSFVCDGVTIEDFAFIGHHVVFVNDRYPKIPHTDWKKMKITVKKHASIGSNVTLVGPLIIGKNSLIGAGSVVLSDVPDNAIIAGNPAKIIKFKSP
jgi:UDP-2-acetamido-3-amino-2,3-dideoxy-glucuronate N-acetyltransferase